MSATFDLSSAIKAHRLSLELSQREYAELYGVNRDMLRMLEEHRHYVDKLQLRVLDRFLAALHMTRRMYDPDFDLIKDAREELTWAKKQGVPDKEIADYLGISSLRVIWDFLDNQNDKCTYHTARTTFALLDDDFRPFIEQCKKITRAAKKPTKEPKAGRETLIKLAQQQGFVMWELEHAEAVDGVLTWMSGCGTYRIELTLTEFKAYFAKTNTLSVYRDLRKKPPIPPKPIQRMQKTVDPIAYVKQATARDGASDMFRAIFAKG